jgi:oligopeptide transport system ATP-binding protein
LLSAVPVPDPVVERARRHLLLRGEIASPLSPPSGCAFRTRCPDAIEACAREIPQPVTHGAKATRVACIRVGDVAKEAPLEHR